MPTKRRPAGRTAETTGTAKRRSSTASRRPESGHRAQDVVYTPAKPFQRNRFLLHMTTVLAVVLALILGMSIFFKVEKINVAGAGKYTAWDVRQASGIQEGENLLTLSRVKIAGRITTQLPYIDLVRVSVKLPDTVIIQVEETDVVYAIEASDNTWWLIDASGKVVDDTNAAAAKAYSRITGVKIESPQLGMPAVAAEPEVEAPDPTGSQDGQQTQPLLPVTTVTGAERLSWVVEILKNLESCGVIGEISSLDVTDSTGMELWYGQRYQIYLGDSSRLKFKIESAKAAIAQMGQYQSGKLDVSYTFWPNEVGYTPFSQ